MLVVRIAAKRRKGKQAARLASATFGFAAGVVAGGGAVRVLCSPCCMGVRVSVRF
jgi:Na+/glutamate symporter